MKENGQKTDKVLEQKEFSEFTTEMEIREFEKKNKSRILATMESDTDALLAFDAKWYKLVGKHWFMPTTSERQQTETFYPKETKYRFKRTISKILWEKKTEKSKQKDGSFTSRVSYYLTGVLTNGKTTTIEFRCAKEQLQYRLGDEDLAQKIIKGTAQRGAVDCDRDLWVLGYWEVIFNLKSSPQDTDDVFLTHEGICLQIMRNKKTILHGYYLEAADNALTPIYIQRDDQPRKIESWSMRYPYVTMREATEEEYLFFKAKGEAIQRAERKKQEQVGD